MMQKFISALLLICLSACTGLEANSVPVLSAAPVWSIEEASRTGASHLDLAFDGIHELSAEIGNLQNLQYLDLSHNYLVRLPPEIGKLHNLRVLYVYDNQLIDLPAEIGNLRNLEIISAHSNRLNSLPSEIGNLEKLCYLDIGNNNISFLPNSLGGLSSFENGSGCQYVSDGIYTYNNPLISPPPQVIAEGTPAILEYLRNEAWWHFQRLVLGGLSFAGIVAGAVLGLRWKNRQGKAKRKNQESI